MPSYGIPEGVEGTLPWAWAEDRLAGAETYWVATTRPGGRPHLVPIWAAWLDGRLWFEGGVVIVNRTGDTLEIEYHVDLSGRDYVMRTLELRPGVMTLFAVPLGDVSP